MSSSVYQGLQSCLEPRLIEPRVLRLKLTPAKSNSLRPTVAQDSDLSATDFETQMKTHMEMGEHSTATTTIAVNTTPATDRTTMNDDGDSENGGWSFPQSLSSASESIKKEKAVYVHPLVKQSSATLSEKSLEMCTESLGSETGSDHGSEISSDEKKISRVSKLRELRASKKLAKPRSNFPPPLTSINGQMGIKVKPHREGGRLVLKAVSFPSVQPCFQVERGGGRLRLRLLKHCFSADLDGEVAGEDEDVEKEEEVSEEDEEYGEAEGETEEEENDENVGGEMGVSKRLRPSRCKEDGGGSKGLLNWEPFWVST